MVDSHASSSLCIDIDDIGNSDQQQDENGSDDGKAKLEIERNQSDEGKNHRKNGKPIQLLKGRRISKNSISDV